LDVSSGFPLKKHELQTERQKLVVEAESISTKGFEPLKTSKDGDGFLITS
jgi:hypothetical protein